MQLQAFLDNIRASLLDVQSFLLSRDGLNNIILALIAIILVAIAIYFIQITKDEQYEKAAFMRTYKKEKRKNIITDVLLRDLKHNVYALNQEKGRPKEKGDMLFNILLIFVTALGVFMVMVHQPVFAVLLPVLLLFIMTKITGLIRKSFSDYVMAQLPGGIESIIRVFSGYDDLKSVLYEAGSTMPMPMKGIFQDLSRKMQTESPEVVLQDFMDTSKDIWIYCLCFNLLSYVEDASKKDIIENLRELKEVIDRDNREKQKQKVERKLTTSINYVLCVIAFVGFVGNLILNPSTSIPFFFGSIAGIGCFLVGMALLVVSIFSNILIGSGKD